MNKRYCITLLTLLFIAIRAASGDSIIIGAPCSSLKPRTATPADTIKISAGTIGSALCSQSCTHLIVPDTSEPPTDPMIPRYLVLVETGRWSTICLQVFGVCNAFSLNLTGLAPGFYSLKVRDSLNCRRSPDGCTYDTPFDTANFTVVPSTGMKRQGNIRQSNGVSLHQSSSHVTVVQTASTEEIRRIEVLDTRGRVVSGYSPACSDKYSIDKKRFPHGMYIVRIRLKNGFVLHRMLVE